MADIFNMADTWNDAGTTFTAIKMNVTDTASAAASLLLDLQVGGTSRLNLRKDGRLTLGGNLFMATDAAYDIGGSGGTNRPRSGYFSANVSVGGYLRSSQDIQLSDGMSAPSAEVGRAKIYVDVSDGDLKVIFGDGTIKTLATDT